MRVLFNLLSTFSNFYQLDLHNKILLHWQINYEASVDIGLKIDLLLFSYGY